MASEIQAVEGVFLKKLFAELHIEDVEYCVWGNYESLPESLASSDLDILVRSSSSKLFKQVLQSSMADLGGSLVSFYATSGSEHIRIGGLHEGIAWGLMIDVIYDEFSYKGRVYIPERWAWHYISEHNGIRVNELGFSYIAGFLKEILHNGTVKDKYLTNAISELSDHPDRYEKFLVDVYGATALQIIKDEFSRGKDSADLARLSSVLRRSIGSSIAVRIVDGIFKIKRIFSPGPGYTIAVLGCDGAGKSAIIDSLTPVLSRTFNKAVYYEHMRPNMLPNIYYLFRRGQKHSGPVTEPHASKPSGFLGSLLRWTYYLTDYVIGYYVKVYKSIKLRSCVWIFDRYYYDFYIDNRRSRVQLPIWILKLGELFVKQPDAVLCLGADPAAIHRRKPELPVEEVARQLASLRGFCENNKRAVWIDTGESLEKSSQDAFSAVFEMMGDRFRHIEL